jgi:hypothetical protein
MRTYLEYCFIHQVAGLRALQLGQKENIGQLGIHIFPALEQSCRFRHGPSAADPSPGCISVKAGAGGPSAAVGYDHQGNKSLSTQAGHHASPVRV